MYLGEGKEMATVNKQIREKYKCDSFKVSYQPALR